MKKLLIIGICILLIGCGSKSPTETNYRTGTQGLTMDFIEGFPNSVVDENEPMPVILHLSNAGAADVNYDNIKITFNYDPLYIKGPTSYDFPQEGEFHGRSIYYPDGEDQLIELFDFATNPLVGQREKPETNFYTQLCYDYNTIYVDEVCIDVEQFLRTGRKQTCTANSLTGTSQGGPLAVTSVIVKNAMVPQTRMIRPSFEVTITNVGQGSVFPAGTCAGHQTTTGATIKAELLGVPLTCIPQDLRFINGQAKTKCTVSEQTQLMQPQYNFNTPILINLSYSYQENHKFPITITKGFDSISNEPLPDQGMVQGYMYDDKGNLIRDSFSNPITQCDYYAEGHDTPRTMSINSNFSCSCTIKECRGLEGSQKCYYGLCPGNIECCDK